MTFKQLEALFWVVHLGGFRPASIRLNTAQSAVTKRVQELELQLGVLLLERVGRSSRLTEKGQELFEHAKRLLELRDEAMRDVGNPAIVKRTLRVGTTELTAMSWLPKLVALTQERYPALSVEPDIDASVALRDKLLADELDLIIVPDAYQSDRFITEHIGEVENAWMCKPGTVKSGRTLSLSELSEYTLLANRSGPGLIYQRWFQTKGFEPSRKLQSNSIVALVSLAVSGLGISYLPKASFQHLVRAGFLEVLEVTPALPIIPYVAMHLVRHRGESLSMFISLAKECCDFSNIVLAGEQGANFG